jgi:AraC-like DNA-binding protein
VSLPTPAAPQASLFQDLLEIFVGDSGLKASFEDLTGFTMDSPELGLDVEHRQHCSAFCVFAKANQVPTRDCVRNKRACNRLAISRRRGFAGMCHLGMTEAVEPLIVKGKVLGVFYFGSCVLKEQAAEAERRIRAFCNENGRDAAVYLKRLRAMPRLSMDDWLRYRTRFEQTVRVIRRLVESSDLPTSGYTARVLSKEAMDRRAMNALTLKALGYVQKSYSESCTLEACAKQIGCHPVHLSRTFKKEAGVEFHEHVHRVRIDHARHLLNIRAMNATRVGYEVGYADASHFTRVFKRITGQTPAVFARSTQRV